MLETKKRPTTSAFKGLLLGSAAFLAGLIPEMGLARVTDRYLLLFLLAAGLVLFKLFLGSQVTWSAILLGSISGMAAAGMGYFIILYVALITMHSSNGPGYITYLLPVVVYGALGITFGLVIFGRRSLRIFTSVFVGFSIALTLILMLLQDRPLLPEQFNKTIFALTKIEFQFLFVYLTIGALLGLSIGLFHQSNPPEPRPVSAEDPTVP